MLNLVIFGAPGSGKGTQSEKITSNFGLHHISTGEVLRDHIKRGTDLGKVADSYISKGQLIPDQLMIDVLRNVLETNPEKIANGVIFDGFPRTVEQANALNDLLKEMGTEVHAVLGLEVPEDELTARMLERGRLTGRADDTPETIKNRLKVYHNQTSPLRDYYLKAGKYMPINGSGNIDEIYDRIHSSLKSKVDDDK